MRRSPEHDLAGDRDALPDSTPTRPVDDAHPAHRLQQAVGNRAVQRLIASGSTVIQRQPRPGAGSTAADPMKFIDEQLARRFVDPDDPRLYVRVQDLLLAAARLPLTEAQDLLERLKARSPSDPLFVNFQRLATASRNRVIAALRRRLPSDIEGKVIGTLTTDAVKSKPLVATLEIVPSAADAGTFAGYDLTTAYRAAERRPTITAIISDAHVAGQFRVFETGEPTVRDAVHPSAAFTLPGGDYKGEAWVNVEGPPLADAKDRAKRIEHAQQLLADYRKKYPSGVPTPSGSTAVTADDILADPTFKAMQDAYKALIAEAIPFAAGQLQSSIDFDLRDRTGLHQLTIASPTIADMPVIDVDVGGVGKHGSQGLIDPQSADRYVKGATSRVALSDMFTALPPEPYQPYVSLTATSVRDDPYHTRSVLLHEESHLAHAQRTIDLYMQWTGSPLPFTEWLDAEVAAKRVSPVDAALARESTLKGQHPNTELLSEAEGLMAGLHVAQADPANYLERLPVMRSWWGYASDDVKALVIRKLQRYYWHMLTPAVRAAFDAYVQDKLATPPEDFYLALLDVLASP